MFLNVNYWDVIRTSNVRRKHFILGYKDILGFKSLSFTKQRKVNVNGIVGVTKILLLVIYLV